MVNCEPAYPTKDQAYPPLKVIPRDQHCISRKNISDGALKVMARLRGQGHQAYLVGGAVRDMLLGGHPKDFDIATDATPEDVHGLFRNSRIIGRRFRIVHVRFGREIIEVTTFRGHHDNGDAGGGEHSGTHSRQSDKGLLLRDNVYGTLEEDAVRRDLSVNALYYDAGNFEVLDHVNGLDDLEARRIRVIGDPAERYREDPVRMLRVLRFTAKLDFDIEQDTAAAIPVCAPLLREIPAARLFDEFLKLFLSGSAAATFDLLLRHDLLQFLFPESDALLQREPNALALVRAAMGNTDQRIAEEKPVTPAFLFAALLWPVTRALAQQLEGAGEPPVPALHSAAQQVVAEAVQHIAIPRRFSQPMREIWEFQHRLTRTRGKKVREIASHRRFRAAYDFLLLREQAGEDTDGLGAWWTDYQRQNPDITQQPAGDNARRPGRRRRPRKRRNSEGQ